MEPEIDLDAIEQDINNKNKIEDRIRDLSQKVKTAAEERDAFAQAKAEAEQARVAAEKERDFFANFSDSIAKYPNANEYKDAIKEKVMGGYSVEDATVAVLAREQKLVVNTPAPERETVAGGSAINNMSAPVNKSSNEMTQAERRAALLEAEKRGDISNY